MFEAGYQVDFEKQAKVIIATGATYLQLLPARHH